SGETLDDSDFPTAVVNTAEGYKEPATWTPADRVVTKENNAFTASATKQNKDIIGPVDPGVTPNPDSNLYWTVTFKSADTATGTVAAKNTYYVLKTANKTLADVKAPATTPAKGYKFDKWTPALDNKTAINKDIEVVGTFVKTVTPPEPQKMSEPPIIDPIYDNDGFVTGEGTPGSTIEVRFPDGEIVETIVDRFGKWEVEVPYRLYEGEIVEARQYEEGKDPSYYVDERVRHFERHWNDKDKDKDKKDEEQTTKPVTPKKVWTPKQLNARDHWAYIKGYQDLTFKPNGNITRAEVAMIFARLSVNKQVVNAPKFSDVKDGDWYKKAVDIVASQGIVKGYEDGSFRPNQPITRREFAAIAARYAGNIDAWKTFRDVTPNDWAYTLINKVAGMGWINGYQDGTFKPDNNITRAESIAIINRMLNRKADANFTISNYNMLYGKFQDVKPTDWYYSDVFEAAFGHTFERMEDGVNEKWNRVVDMMFGLN
ncbi:MAG: S-layer homology domain-containing protein, partial [Ezakiella sp.]|nr:S-layer homology domain-containing protein [Bacillota bacterium]MDY3923642.1 S-layer homology domain-containing protein [Ezakiella sp.]